MILSRLGPLVTIITLTACQSVLDARAARLTAQPDAPQTLAIQTAVQAAMKRSDIDMDPGRLVDSSILLVRPVAVEGLTDRVPGTPRNFTLMTTGTSCFLLEAGGGMRIELPGLRCV